MMVCAASAGAANVYKCTNANGDLAYQDYPCPPGADETRLHLTDVPPADVASASPDYRIATPVPKPDVPRPPSPRAPLPPLWLCENAEDGSGYFSANGNPPVRYVPLGTLGFPGKSMAQAYGPGGGSGISAPGVNRIPISTSPRDAAATQLTALQDACAPASPEQTCSHLRKQYDEVEHKLKRAFKDERAVLEPRERELEAQLDNC
jgi:hypothetical protein